MRVSTEGAKKFCFGSFMKRSVWTKTDSLTKLVICSIV